MKRLLSFYQYLAPLVLAPASFVLWQRASGGQPQVIAIAWGLPILWAYILPGLGTNVFKVWEFDVRLKLGRFRPQHGFVFGSATAMIAWLVHADAIGGSFDLLRQALVFGAVLGFVNLIYDIKALEAGVLHVYNEPWADGLPASAIAMDYAPWIFGGFGVVYGAALSCVQWLTRSGPLDAVAFALLFGASLILALALPTGGFMLQSLKRHGHAGTRPIEKRTPCAKI